MAMALAIAFDDVKAGDGGHMAYTSELAVCECDDPAAKQLKKTTKQRFRRCWSPFLLFFNIFPRIYIFLWV